MADDDRLIEREALRERSLALARQRMRLGDLRGAIEALRGVLAGEPERAEAHALLAACLVDMRRLHAAEHEAHIALRLAPEEPLSHRVAGLVQLARRRLGAAEEHFRQVLELAPEDAAALRSLAQVEELRGRRSEARALLEKALAADPEDPETLTDLGRWHLGRGELGAAYERTRQALELEPADSEALVVMGYILLRRGEVDEAREHALWALREDPGDRQSLRLLAAIQARRSWFLGLWWRLNAWLGELGTGRSVAVLLGAYLASRVAVIAAGEAGNKELASLLSLLWVAFCAYTWVSPGLFRRSVQRALAEVELDERF